MKSYKHLLPVLLLALAACTDQDNINPGTNPEDNPNTPVSFSLTLQGMQAAGTRSNTRADGNGSTLSAEEIAKIPAREEITMDSNFENEETLLMYLPGVTNTGGIDFDNPEESDLSKGTGYYYLTNSENATLSNPGWKYMKNETEGYASLPTLYMKDFSHDRSRLGIVAVYGGDNDFTYAITQRSTGSNGFTYAYTLHHTAAKVSLLLQDKDGRAIPAGNISGVSISSYYVQYSDIVSLEGKTILEFGGEDALFDFYPLANAPLAPSTSTALPGPDDLEMAYVDNYRFHKFTAGHPQSATSTGSIPDGLWNAIVRPNPTHDLKTGTITEDDGDKKTVYTYPRYTAGKTHTGADASDLPFTVQTIATGRTYPKASPEYPDGSGTTGSSDKQPICVAPYLDSDAAKDKKTHCITVTLEDGSSTLPDGSPGPALPAGTYRIPLSSIALTGLPENDARRTDFDPTGRNGLGSTGPSTGPGTLKYLLPGEHLLVVLTLDRQQGLTATATIGDWSLTEVNLGNLGDPEDTGGDIVKD